MADLVPAPPAPPTEAGPSLRERKKARTRAALIEVSQRLFAEQGYTATTLDDICAEVEVTPQTLLRYFDSKAHLALAPMADAVGELEQFLAHPDRHLATLVVWREFVSIEAREIVDPSSPERASQIHNLRAYRRWTEKDPALVAMSSDIDRRVRDLLTVAMARDWDAPADDLHAAVVAGALVAGRLAVWSRWLDGELTDDGLLASQHAVIDYVKKRMPRSTARALPGAAGHDTPGGRLP